MTIDGGVDGAGEVADDADATAKADANAPVDATVTSDSSPPDTGLADASASDSRSDADPPSVTVTALSIVSAYGTPLQGAPGDAIPLVVVLTLSDGTTRQATPGEVTWVAPLTLVAEDPYDAGPNTLPEAGAHPAAFYVQNDYRQESPGTLFILDRGSLGSPQVTVTASIADAGQVSASVSILPPLTGDPDAGGNLFQYVLRCTSCHGLTGGGSPLARLPDGGLVLLDGGPAYVISGQDYPFPAPGLNAGPGGLAADPAWDEALFAIAAQSGIDNQGVGLRMPMPLWAGGNNGTGNPLNAQNFADIYAWLKTQKQ